MSDSSASDSSSDGDFGPLPPSEDVRPTRKRKVEFNDALYLRGFPSAMRYAKSFAHKDYTDQIVCSHQTQYIAVGTDAGCITFWYYERDGLQFVKKLHLHRGRIIQMRGSRNGLSLGSISQDMTYKHIDFPSFDLVSSIPLHFRPLCMEFISKDNDPHQIVAM